MDAFNASLFGSGNVRARNASGGLEVYKGVTKDSAEYNTIKANLVDVANSLEACAPGESKMMLDFFNHSDNWKGILDAKDKLGLPAKNRASYKNGGLFGRWNDFCDTDAPLKFYVAAKKYVSVRAVEDVYPILSKDANNCYELKSALALIDKDRANNLDDADMKAAFEDKITEYNGLYSKLSCDKYIIDQEKLSADKASAEKEKAAIQNQQQAFDYVVNPQVVTAPQAQPTSMGTYALYGFAGIAGVLFLVVLAKKISK